VPDTITVPVKVIGTDRWAQLNFFGDSHSICGEKVKSIEENYTFAGGHRVRLYVFKKNVHWKIPAGISLDVGKVNPAAPPPRRLPNR
jgi:hypothetical protein